MGEVRADPGAWEALILGTRARLATRPGCHLDIHAFHDCAETRVERVAGLGQIDGNLADHATGVRREDQQPIAHFDGLLDVVRDHQHGLDRQLPLTP